jgi:hypothetical protein
VTGSGGTRYEISVVYHPDQLTVRGRLRRTYANGRLVQTRIVPAQPAPDDAPVPTGDRGHVEHVQRTARGEPVSHGIDHLSDGTNSYFIKGTHDLLETQVHPDTWRASLRRYGLPADE